MSERDDDEAPDYWASSDREQIDGDRVVPLFDGPALDRLMPKFDGPALDRLMPKFDGPALDRLMPKFDGPALDRLMPKFDGPALDHLMGMPDRLTGWLDSAVPRVDMTAWSNVVRTAFAVDYMHDTMTAAARRIFDIDRVYRGLDDLLLSPALSNVFSRIDEITHLAPAMQSAAQAWTAQVNDLMQGWAALSRFGHRLANKALHLALATRDAVVNNPDRNAVRDAVIDFMRRALGYKSPPTEARIEAVVSALLDDTWLPPGDTTLDYNPSNPIRKIVASEHALWLPMSETRPLGGCRMASLEKPDQVALGSDSGNPTSPMDRLQSDDFTPEQQPIQHPVLKRLMDPLSVIEQEIVWTRLYDGARTWADAATMCGRPPSEGATVRRKFLKLKNAEEQSRSA